MSLCIICSFRKLYPFQKADQGRSPTHLTRELDELHRLSFNSLMALLAVLTLKGSKALLPAVLALLIYTISLRLAVNVCFIQNHPAWTRFLHAVPLLGTICMAGAELVLDMRSPAIAVVILLLSILPLATAALPHGRQCEECRETPLPIRMRDTSGARLGHGVPLDDR